MTEVIKIRINGNEWHEEDDPGIEENPYEMELVSGSFYEGNTVTVRLADGREYTRKVRDERLAGLYIMIHNTKFYETDIK